MKLVLLFCGCLLFLKLGAQSLKSIPLTTVDGKKYTLGAVQNSLIAVVFLSPDCPLSQNYTLVLNTIQKNNAEAVVVVGVFTGKDHTRNEITAFQKKYRVSFSLARDTEGTLAGYARATVTPQVFLYDSNSMLIYKGAIDDWVISLGKKKQRAEQQYLQNAITGYLNHQKIDPFETKAVGCLISRK